MGVSPKWEFSLNNFIAEPLYLLITFCMLPDTIHKTCKRTGSTTYTFCMIPNTIESYFRANHLEEQMDLLFTPLTQTEELFTMRQIFHLQT